MILATYRNIPKEEYTDHLEIGTVITKDVLIVRDQVIPGMAGYPDMYIKKYQFEWGILIAYTYNKPLSEEELKALIGRVKRELKIEDS